MLTRVPGRARPRPQALKEFEDAVAELRRRYAPALAALLAPKAEDMYRWRVQLECGCVREVMTRGKDSYPDARSDVDPFTGCSLLPGEYWRGAGHATKTSKPYRDIVEWAHREVKDFPADPEEPEYGLDPETWAAIRHAGPHSSAFWLVKLECGHYRHHVVTDVDWKPEDGPRTVSRARRDEMRRDLEELWASEAGQAGWPEEGPERDHVRKMLDIWWPRPEPEQECYACARATKVTGYQRIGWLVPPAKPPATAPTEKERIRAQLVKAEAEVRQLRRKLEDESRS